METNETIGIISIQERTKVRLATCWPRNVRWIIMEKTLRAALENIQVHFGHMHRDGIPIICPHRSLCDWA